MANPRCPDWSRKLSKSDVLLDEKPGQALGDRLRIPGAQANEDRSQKVQNELNFSKNSSLVNHLQLSPKGKQVMMRG